MKIIRKVPETNNHWQYYELENGMMVSLSRAGLKNSDPYEWALWFKGNIIGWRRHKTGGWSCQFPGYPTVTGTRLDMLAAYIARRMSK